MIAPHDYTPPEGLWDHQRDGLEYLRDRRYALLDMDMGTGKTILTLEASRMWNAKRVLVVCPPLPAGDVWPKNADKRMPGHFDVVRLDSKQSKAKKLATLRRAALHASVTGKPLMVVVNFEMCWRAGVATELLDFARGALLVVDESHKSKAPFGKASKFLTQLGARAEWILLLTGTPMPHDPLDVFAQFRIMDPAIFGPSFVAFRSRYAIVQKIGRAPIIRGFRNQGELAARMAPHTFHVEGDVLDLPPAIHEQVRVDLSPEAQRIYNEVKQGIVAQIEDGEITAANALTQVLRLQQITGGWATLDDGTVSQVDTTKQDALAQLIESAGTEPFVAFGRYRADLDSIHEAAASVGATSMELSGRRKELDQWQRGEARVLSVQQQSGGTSVDFTRARYCAFYSLGYSLGEYKQALARVRRPSPDGSMRTDPVVYYHLTANNTVDGTVYGSLRSKRNVIESVMQHLTTEAQNVH